MSAPARDLVPATQHALPGMPNESRALVTIRNEDPTCREIHLKMLRNALAPLLCKVAPSLTDDAAKRWKAATAESLSNLPADLVIEAARTALYEPLRLEAKTRGGTPRFRPIQSAGEIETLVRQQAEVIRSRSRARLQIAPQRNEQIERKPEPTSTQAEVDELNAYMRHFKIDRRWCLGADQRLEPVLTPAELRRRANHPLP